MTHESKSTPKSPPGISPAGNELRDISKTESLGGDGSLMWSTRTFTHRDLNSYFRVTIHEVAHRTCTFLSVWKPPRLIFVFDIETPHHDVQIPRLCAIRKDNCRTQPAKRRTKNNYQQSCTWVSDTTALEVRSETSAQSKSTPRADDSQTARSRNTCRGSSLAHHPQTTTLLVPRIPSTPPGPSTRFLRV